MPVPCAGCVLSGRGPADGPIPHPEKSYCVCVTECNQGHSNPQHLQ